MVVIGAGIAGLTAARRLREAGVEALVLEARGRVGGRTLNHELGEGRALELGGQWVGPGQERILGLIAELGLETFPTNVEGRKVFEHGDRLSTYGGEIPRVNPLALLDLQRALRRIERLRRQVDPQAPWEAPRAARMDSETVASWLRRNTFTALARDLFTLSCEAIWAADPAEISQLHCLAYSNAAGGMQALISTAGGAQERRIIGGSQQVALQMAAALGDAVMLERPVRRIEHSDGVRLLADGIEVDARRAIVAISPALAGRIEYWPALPARRDQLTQRVPNGSVIKCMAVYREPFWRQRGLSGQAISDRGPVKVAYDNSPPQGDPGVLLGFLEGKQARELGRCGQAERRAAVLDCFTRFFGPEAAAPLDYIERDWSEEEWTRGCYGAFFGPNTWSACGKALRNPVGPIHWAGAETATRWMGYMDGAVSSAERAVDEVTASLDVLAVGGLS